MKRLLIAGLAAVPLLLAQPAFAQRDDLDRPPSVEELMAEIDRLHPSGYFMLAAQLLESDPLEAGKWLYVGQIRGRLHMAAEPDLPPDEEPALYAALMEVVGRPVNEKIGESVDEWLSVIDTALEWDAANPNGFTSKEENAAALAEIRGGLEDLRAQIDRDRDDFRERRRANGLSVR